MSNVSPRILALGCDQNASDGPSTLQPLEYDHARYSGTFRPFRDTHARAAKLKNYICSCVSRLLFLCCPSAVAGFIVTVVVDAINRQFARWPFSHIGQEVLKLTPPIAHANAPSAIVLVCPIGAAIADVKHSTPRVPSRRKRHSVCAILGPPNPRASTGRSVSVVEILHNNVNQRATVAYTRPQRLFGIVSAAISNGRQATKPLSRYIEPWLAVSARMSHSLVAPPMRFGLGPLRCFNTVGGLLDYTTLAARRMEVSHC